MRGPPAFRFENRRLLRPFGPDDGRQPIGFGRLDDRGLELLLPAQDFLLLDRDHLLRPHPIDFHFLADHRLPRRGLRQRPGLLRARFLRLDLGLILRLADHEVARGQRDVGVGLELRLLPLLHRLRGLDLRVAVRFGLADGRVALDFGGAALAERVQVAFFVADLLDRQHVDADPHLLEVLRRLARQLLREALAIAVDLLHGQRAEDRSQVPFERLEDHLLHLVVRHAEKPLGRRLQRRVVAADLDVGDRLDRHGHALQRVGPLDLERDRHHVEVQVLDFLEERNPERRAAAHHPVADDAAVGQLALAAAQHRHRVRRDLQVVAAEEPRGREKREHDAENGQYQCGQLQLLQRVGHGVLTFSVSSR